MQKIKKILSFITLPLVFFELVIIFYFAVPQLTQDLGELMLLGKVIFTIGFVPKINLLSYVFSNYSYLNSQWLSEIILYLIHNFFGIQGLITLGTILGVFSSLIIYLTAAKNANIKIGNTFLMNLALTIYLILYFTSSTIRPELFSFFLMSIFMFILYKYKSKYTKLVFLLIPLEILWVNLHIYFLIGEILVLIFIIADIWDKRKNLKFLLTTKESKTLIIVFFGVIIASFVNPNFYHGALYPLTFSSNYGVSVQENINLLFYSLQPNVQFSFILIDFIIISVFAMLFFNKQRTILDFLLVMVFGMIGISAIRNLPLFAFATFPFFVSSIYKINLPEKKEKLFLFLALLLFFFLFFSELNDSYKINISNQNDEKAKTSALDFFVDNNLHGPIFNNYDIGSYIAYRLYPKEKPFIDSRPEAYPASFFSGKYPLMANNIGYFNAIAQKFKFNAIILYYLPDSSNPIYHTMIKNLVYSSDWKLVYINSEVLIFLKNLPDNKDSIQKFGVDKNNLKINNIPNNSTDLFSLAYLFNTIGWTNQEAEIYKLVLKIDGKNCQALEKVSEIITKNGGSAADYIMKYNKYCGYIFIPNAR